MLSDESISGLVAAIHNNGTTDNLTNQQINNKRLPAREWARLLALWVAKKREHGRTEDH